MPLPHARPAPRLLLAALLLTMMWPATALPYAVSLTGQSTGEVVRWFKSNVPYHLHPSCSTDLPASTCLSECKASFESWLGKSCSTLKMSYAGQSTNLKLVAVGYNANGKNEVAWIENSAWQYGKYVLGVTSPYFFTTDPQKGHITEADIAMNGYLQTWSTSGKSYSTDVRNVLVHEIGHFFGLQHNLYPNVNNPETMAPTADPFMKSRTPEADDVAGLCYLYPATGKTSCSSNDDCPYIIVDTNQGEKYGGVIPCNSGSCGGQTAQVAPEAKKLGDGCAGSDDCASPMYCQPMSGSQAVCSKDCNPSAKNCPGGFSCVPFQNDPNKGACIKGGGPSPSKDLGQSCKSSNECKSQLCVNEGNGQFCRQPCGSDGKCPSGQKCSLFAGKNYGACFPDQGNQPPALKDNGESCQSSTECKSDLCVGGGQSGSCVQDCGPAKPCASGYACVKISGGGGVCFKAGQKKLGDACEDSLSCAGGLCAASGGKYICSQPCSASNKCPPDFTCYPLSGGGGGCFKAPSKKGDGQTCTYSSECQSGLCVGTSGAAKCVQPCSTSNDQCLPGYICTPLSGGGGACIKLGDKKMGQTCGKPSDCASGDCVGLGSSGFVCTQACKATSECDCGFECQAFSGGSKFCVNGKKVACVGNEKPCTNDSQCVSGVCLAGTCATTCSIYTGANTCGAGKGCVRLSAGKPEGACAPKGKGGFGGACKVDLDCISLFCHGGACSKACSPFLPNSCTFGLQCTPAKGDVGHCAQPATKPDPGAADAGSAAADAGALPATDAGSSAADGVVGSLDGAADAGGTTTNPPPPGDDAPFGCSSAPREAPTAPFWPLLIVVALLMGWRRRSAA